MNDIKCLYGHCVPAWTKGAVGCMYRMNMADAENICKGIRNKVFRDWKRVGKSRRYEVQHFDITYNPSGNIIAISDKAGNIG